MPHMWEHVQQHGKSKEAFKKPYQQLQLPRM